MERVISSPTFARVFVVLLDAIETPLRVGGVLSYKLTVLLYCVVDAALSAAS